MLLVEASYRLKASWIPHREQFRLEINGRVFGVNATPQTVAIVSGPLAQRIERVKLRFGGKARGGFTVWFKCPTCGRKTPVLYLPRVSLREGKFQCHRCLGLKYAAWQVNNRYRWPRDEGAWLKRFCERASKVLGGDK